MKIEFIDTLLFNVTDIELDSSKSDFNTNRPDVIAYISVNNTFINAVWRNRIEIPLISKKGNLQIIIKENDSEQRKLGSISIPINLFFEIEKMKTYSHWITLFDYIEDDEYDGDLGYDDEEKPRCYIRYGIEGDPSSKATKTISRQYKETKEERKGGAKVVTTTKTATYSISSPSRVKQAEPEPEQLRVVAQTVEEPVRNFNEIVSEDTHKYSVRVLEDGKWKNSNVNFYRFKTYYSGTYA